MAINKQRVVKIILIVIGAVSALTIILVVLSFLFIKGAVKDFENINDLAILKQQQIVQYTPSGVNQMSYEEIDKSKDNNQIIKSGNYSSTITRTFQLSLETTPEMVAKSIVEKATTEGWDSVAPSDDMTKEGTLAVLLKDCDTEKVLGKNCSMYIDQSVTDKTMIVVTYSIF